MTTTITPPTTPDTPGTRPRDQVLDVARAGALTVVVAWHWVFSVVSVDDNGPHVGNPVGVTPGMWAATWILQVMPLFFMVGGAVHATALTATNNSEFVTRRLRRLITPALPLVAPALAAWVAATITGHTAVANTIVLVASPLWFAATYAALVVIAPHSWAAQRRWPLATPTVLLAAVAALDYGRFAHGIGGATYTLATFVVVWAAVHHLGYFWTALRTAGTGTRLAVAAAGYTALGFAVTIGPYPTSMVGIAGEEVSNMSPPNLTVICLAVGQLGLLAAAAGPITRLAQRHRSLVEQAARWSMTVYVWHLAAWLIAYAVLRGAGVTVPDTIGSDWWAQRPLWIAAPLAASIPLCQVMRRFDRAGATTTTTPAA